MDAQTLIKKLSKSGKYVELWPEKKPDQKKEKVSGKAKINEKQKLDGANEAAEPKNKTAQKPESSAAAKNSDAGTTEEDQTPGAAGDQIMGGVESEEPNTTTTESGGGNGSSKKKKKKGINPAGPINRDAPAGDTLSDQALPLPMATESMNPNHPVYPYPPIYYGVSYNTTYPSFTSTSSYYTNATTTQYSNAYGPPPPPSDPVDQFNEDDEYYDIDVESGCSIM